jgi:hypothetical protein
MPGHGALQGGRTWIFLHLHCMPDADAEGTVCWQEEQWSLYAALLILLMLLLVAMVLLIVIVIPEGTWFFNILHRLLVW